MNRRNFLSIFPIATVGIVTLPSTEEKPTLENKIVKCDTLKVLTSDGKQFSVLAVDTTEEMPKTVKSIPYTIGTDGGLQYTSFEYKLIETDA